MWLQIVVVVLFLTSEINNIQTHKDAHANRPKQLLQPANRTVYSIYYYGLRS